MSVTRALVELKRFEERITRAINEGLFVTSTVGLEANRKVNGLNKTVAETSQMIQGSFDKVDSLIKNRAAVKAAIVKSNAATKVNILNQEMTVAEAIELKSTVNLRSLYLNQIRTQLQRARLTVDAANKALEESIDKLLTTAYGNEKGKVESAQFDAISAPQRRQRQAELLDPVGVESRIEKLQEEISQINSEIDFALSESNARTEIEVEV